MELYPFLPYLLQDSREIGASPDEIAELIRNSGLDQRNDVRAVDLGCGKGAVSIRLAKEFGFFVHGIDAIPDFVRDADRWADECGVKDLCRFEQDDIRLRVSGLTDYDIAVLGAIGPVLGDLEQTLLTVRKCLKPFGHVILDHGYIPDDSAFARPDVTKRCEMLRQIQVTGMEIVEERIMGRDFMQETNEILFDRIRVRAMELIERHPEKRDLFEGYVQAQEDENDVLENKIVCGTWLLRKTG